MTAENIQTAIQIVQACETVQMATFALNNYPETRHLLNALNRNTEDLNLHFITNDQSPKYEQLGRNPNVCLYYFNPENRHTVRLFGQIKIITDIDLKEKFWLDDFTSFGYSGFDDPHFALLRFVPQEYKFYVGGNLVTGKI